LLEVKRFGLKVDDKINETHALIDNFKEEFSRHDQIIYSQKKSIEELYA
jgi:hypothetical protein